MVVTLSARLQTVANLVPQGARVVDVGTDHALLPIHLVQTGVATSVIATDIAPLPVQSAFANVRAHGLTDTVDVRLGPGLQIVREGEVDTVIIAGMGGGTMRDVLLESAALLRGVSRIIVQPMNLGQHVRAFFLDQGWTLMTERAVADHGRVYEVFAATPSLQDEALRVYETFAHDEVAMSVALQLGPILLCDEPSKPFLKRVEDTLHHWRERQRMMTQSVRDSVSDQVEHLGQQIAWLDAWYQRQARSGRADR